MCSVLIQTYCSNYLCILYCKAWSCDPGGGRERKKCASGERWCIWRRRGSTTKSKEKAFSTWTALWGWRPGPATDVSTPSLTEKAKKELQTYRSFPAILTSVDATDVSTPSLTEKAKKELQTYRSFPAILTSVDPLLWWWQKSDQIPMLASLAKKYLCVQASSTRSERVFSIAGDTISMQRAWLLPDIVDMLVFLKKELLKICGMVLEWVVCFSF